MKRIRWWLTRDLEPRGLYALWASYDPPVLEGEFYHSYNRRTEHLLFLSPRMVARFDMPRLKLGQIIEVKAPRLEAEK